MSEHTSNRRRLTLRQPLPSRSQKSKRGQRWRLAPLLQTSGSLLLLLLLLAATRESAGQLHELEPNESLNVLAASSVRTEPQNVPPGNVSATTQVAAEPTKEPQVALRRQDEQLLTHLFSPLLALAQLEQAAQARAAALHTLEAGDQIAAAASTRQMEALNDQRLHLAQLSEAAAALGDELPIEQVLPAAPAVGLIAGPLMSKTDELLSSQQSAAEAALGDVEPSVQQDFLAPPHASSNDESEGENESAAQNELASVEAASGERQRDLDIALVQSAAKRPPVYMSAPKQISDPAEIHKHLGPSGSSAVEQAPKQRRDGDSDLHTAAGHEASYKRKKKKKKKKKVYVVKKKSKKKKKNKSYKYVFSVKKKKPKKKKRKVKKVVKVYKVKKVKKHHAHGSGHHAGYGGGGHQEHGKYYE